MEGKVGYYIEVSLLLLCGVGSEGGACDYYSQFIINEETTKPRVEASR